MAFPDCSHVSATDTSRPTGADYIYCLAKEVRKLKESIAAGNGVFDVLAANVIEPLPTSSCDPYWDNVVLAMHMDESPFIDEKGGTVTAYGDATLGAGKFEGGAAFSDAGALGIATTALTIENSDFVLRFWVYSTVDSTGNRQGLYVNSAPGFAGGGGNRSFSVYLEGGYLTANVTNSYSASTIFAATTLFPLNQNVFVEFGREGDFYFLSQNGHIEATGEDDEFFGLTKVNLINRGGATIGAINYFGGADNGFTGVVDDLTVHINVAPNTADFTPPTAPFAAVACTNCDPYWNNVVAAFHFNGSDASTTFIDEIGTASQSPSGSPAITTAESVFNGSCLDLGAGDSLQITLASSIFDNWTIECFYKHKADGLMFNFGADGVWLGERGPAEISYRNAGSGYSTVGTATESTFFHLAICNTDGILSFFIEGIKSSFTVSAFESSLQSVVLGGPPFFGGPNPGYFAELIITSAVKYTADFTPPTAPFADVAC